MKISPEMHDEEIKMAFERQTDAEATVANEKNVSETVLKLSKDVLQYAGTFKTMHANKPDDAKAKTNYNLLEKLSNSKTLALAVDEAHRRELTGMRAGK